MDDQECKCYKVLSTKPLPHNGQVCDILESFLRNDKESQLNLHSSAYFVTEEGGQEVDRDQHHQLSQLDHDLVREKASWNELRRWANELMEEGDGTNSNRKRQRKPIEAWKGQPFHNDNADSEDKGLKLEEEETSHRSFPQSESDTDNVYEENRMISTGLIKAETMESTGRAEVSIVGRGATQSFEDHFQSDLDDIEDIKRKKLKSREAKRARKNEKKQAKKVKKEAKKVKEESKKHKRKEVAVKIEEE